MGHVPLLAFFSQNSSLDSQRTEIKLSLFESWEAIPRIALASKFSYGKIKRTKGEMNATKENIGER